MAPLSSSRAPNIRTLLRQAREPIFVLSPQGRFLFVNEAWEELTGYSFESVSGVVCGPSGPSPIGALAALAAGFRPPPEALRGRPHAVSTLIVLPDGERRRRRLEFHPLHDSQGGLLGLLGFVREADSESRVPEAESRRLQAELLEVRARLIDRHSFDSLIGLGPQHRRLLDQISAAAATDVPVLIVGEPGTGKRLIARTVQARSRRAGSAFATVDCAALPPEALERRLFGDVGARSDPNFDPEKPASTRLDPADAAALLLHEILEVPRDLQARLAAVSAAGSRSPRLLGTTSGDPEQARIDGRLRPDFYFAITTMVLRVAPLRDRLDELPLLAQHFLERANARGRKRREGFAAEAIDALSAYDWPGNLRELARVVDEAHASGEADLISVADIPASIRGNLGAAHPPPAAPNPSLDDLLGQFERYLIEQALLRARRNKSRAAKLLNISRPRLYHRIKELNLPDEADPLEEAGE